MDNYANKKELSEEDIKNRCITPALNSARWNNDEFRMELKVKTQQMRAAGMLQMDLLARKIFSNLEIDQQKTVLYRYKEPFQTLISGVKTGQITCGEPGGTRTHDTKLKRLVL